MTSSSVFWLCLGLVAYAYAGYPLLAAGLAHWRGRAPATGEALPALTVVICACNEEQRIADRVRDVLAQDYPADRLHVLVVSDGSRDGTVRAAAIDDPRVTVLALEHNRGKAVALNAGLAQVTTGIVVFADARQRFAPGAIRALVAAFADPQVGAISGELQIRPTGNANPSGNTGLYWRMEKRLRHDEAMLGWLHGASGAIHAVRRDLFKPMPAGTVLDDMWIPLQALLAGSRTWMARDAVAIDQPSTGAAEEFRRKLRTLAGNWQLLARLPVLANPFRNPVLFAWLSHKFLRLMVPWALLAALVASASAPSGFMHGLFYLQLLAYMLAAIALALPGVAARIPLLPVAGTFVMLNGAALLSLPAALLMDPSRLWKKH